MRIPGLFVCECGNSTPIAELVKGVTGISGPVYVFPDDVVCGCGRRMQRWYEEEEKDVELPSVPSGDHLVGTGGRNEGPARREGEPGLRPGPLPDRPVDDAAEDREGGRGVTADGAGGSPGDLPPAASHLAIGREYLLTGGDYIDHLGRLTKVEVSDFGMAFGVLDVRISADVWLPDVKLVADKLQPVE